jgi:hypothetical protein
MSDDLTREFQQVTDLRDLEAEADAEDLSRAKRWFNRHSEEAEDLVRSLPGLPDEEPDSYDEAKDLSKPRTNPVSDFLWKMFFHPFYVWRETFEWMSDLIIVADAGAAHNIAEFVIGKDGDGDAIHCVAATAHEAALDCLEFVAEWCVPDADHRGANCFPWADQNIGEIETRYRAIEFDTAELARLVARICRERARVNLPEENGYLNGFPSPQLVSLDQVAALTTVTVATLKKYVRDGKLPRPARKGGGRERRSMHHYQGLFLERLKVLFPEVSWPDRLPELRPRTSPP